MANHFDKILKENLQSLILPLLHKTLGLNLNLIEKLPETLSYTVGREADAIMKVIENGTEMILHVEFQSNNDPHMIARMLQYYALLYKTYLMPVVQCVIYLGEEEMKMENVLNNSPAGFVFTYHLIDIKKTGYSRFLASASPEEVILAILAGKENDKDEVIINKIFLKLQELLPTSDLLLIQKIKQLEVLALLRNTRDLIIKQEQNMALVIDITKDKLYQKGEEMGIEKGKREERILVKFETAKLMLIEGIETSQILKITGLSAKQIDKLKNDLGKNS